MNVLFLSLIDFETVGERSIYTDLLREFVDSGHNVYVVSPVERRKNRDTCLIYDRYQTGENGSVCQILKVRIGNIQKTNRIEKGISTLLIEKQCIRAVEKYFKEVRFDLVLYATPPITFAKAAGRIKKRDQAVTYLLLKDIFPQNAVDLGMFSTKSPFYWYFRGKEKKLYRISDFIGCMSQANVDYLLSHNQEIKAHRTEVCPNSVNLPENWMKEQSQDSVERRERKKAMRERFRLPEDKQLFLYGGNLGKPQDVPYLIECLKVCSENQKAFFVVCGTGTEYAKLEAYQKEDGNQNLCLMEGLPKKEYDELTAACDVGLIFLDHRFTIPNYPSRLLSYMEQGLPVLAATDENTDIGQTIVEGGFGYTSISDNPKEFSKIVKNLTDYPGQIPLMGENAQKYLYGHFTTRQAYQTILSHFE